jgi:hypothetical protein
MGIVVPKGLACRVGFDAAGPANEIQVVAAGAYLQ